MKTNAQNTAQERCVISTICCGDERNIHQSNLCIRNKNKNVLLSYKDHKFVNSRYIIPLDNIISNGQLY